MPVYVVAELGQNHQGDFAVAKQLAREVAAAGADCLKLQRSSLPDKFTRAALERPYSGPNSFGTTYGQHKAALELDDGQWLELKRICEKELRVAFSASAMDLPSADWLVNLDVPFVKIGSGDVDNWHLLEHLGRQTEVWNA